MIVSRRYVPFVWLFDRDPQSKSILETAYARSKMSKREQKKHWDMLCAYRVSVNTAEMGMCIPEFAYIISEFDRLDKEYPYDNGFNMCDVNRVDIVDQSSDAIHLRLYNVFDGDEHIIGFSTINTTDIMPILPL